MASWVILAAVAVKELASQTKSYGKLLAIGVLVLLLADAAGDHLLYYQVNNGNRRDWKGAFTLVQEQSKQGDVFVAWWPQFGRFYLDHEIVRWRDINPGVVVGSGKRFWFITDSETVWGNMKMKTWVEQNAELIEVKYLRREDDFYLRIYLYDPARNTGSKQSEGALLDLSSGQRSNYPNFSSSALDDNHDFLIKTEYEKLNKM